MEKWTAVFMEWYNVTYRCYALQLHYSVIFAPLNFVTNSTCYTTQFAMVLYYGVTLQAVPTLTLRYCWESKINATIMLNYIAVWFLTLFNIVASKYEKIWFMVKTSNAGPQMDISQIYFLWKQTNPERQFLKTNCQKNISLIIFTSFFNFFTISFRFSQFFFIFRNFFSFFLMIFSFPESFFQHFFHFFKTIFSFFTIIFYYPTT